MGSERLKSLRISPFMEKTLLTVQLRDKSVKAKEIRRNKMIPAEFYGHGVENVSIQMNYQAFRKMYRVAGKNTVIDLKIEGKGDKSVLIHRIDFDTVTDDISYVEFINVRMDEVVTAKIPLVLEGTAPAVREVGAVLIQNLDALEISCLPGDLPHEILVNVDGLTDASMSIHVSDLKLSSKITILADPEESIVSLFMPKEEEAAPAEAVDVSKVEVTTEKKDDAEGSKA